MGLDCTIQYRKGKENVAANALSQCFEEGMVAAITLVLPDWLQEVTANYTLAEWSKELLGQLLVDPSSRSGYTMTNGLIRFHGRIVIGDCEHLKSKIMQALHESPMGGHSEGQAIVLLAKLKREV